LLKELQISDFALIDRVQLSFNPGLNVLTGETGAGKSIIIDALSLLLGARASVEMIRTGCERAVIEGAFIPVPAAQELLHSWGMDCDEDLIIAREIYRNGRNRCRINGHLATVNQLGQLGSLLVDILGQHDQQSLLHVTRHLQILDTFADQEHQKLMEKVREQFNRYEQVRSERLRLQNQERERLSRIDLLQFQIQEITQANLQVGEEDELLKKRDRLANIERITNTAENVYQILQEHSEMPPIYDQLASAVNDLQSIMRYDEQIMPIIELFNQALVQLEEGSRDLRRYIDAFDERDPHALEQIETRLTQLRTLKRKYGKDEQAILDYLEQIKQEYEQLLNSETRLEQLEREEQEIQAVLKSLTDKLTIKRCACAQTVQQRIEAQLAELNMEGTRFVIDIKPASLSATGCDAVEFLIAPNKGEELKPLAKIASGGEMSRIMLALKNSLVEAEHIPTLVFDEVDTGIGGRTATKIAQKLRNLSDKFQVFVVTHLPVVASYAQYHYYVEKHEENGRTVVSITQLDYQGRIQELVRMLGGKADEAITEAHARELLKQATTS